MIFLLDTNILSAIMLPKPPEEVLELGRKFGNEHWVTAAVCQAEICAGIAVVPRGRRRERLERAAHELFEVAMAGKVLAFDHRAAPAYGEMIARRRRKGLSGANLDLMIAATAQVHGAAIVTRNVFDFEECGVEVVNPWDMPDGFS